MRFYNRLTPPRLRTTSYQVLFEFGSAFTKVVLNGRLIFYEPTIFVWRPKEEKVWLLGQSAYLSQAKLADDFLLVRPIKRKAIANVKFFRLYLAKLLQALKLKQVFLPWKRFKVQVILPAEITEAQRQLLKEVVRGILPQARFSLSTKLVLSHRRFFNDSRFLLDLSRTLSLTAFHQGQVVDLKHYFWGEVELDQQLRSLVQDRFGAKLDVFSLDHLKRQLVSLNLAKTSPKQLVIRAKDVKTGLGRTIALTSQDLLPAVEVWFEELVDYVGDFFAQLEGVAAVDLVENGLSLVGGLAKLDHLDEALSQRLGCEVKRLPHSDLFLIEQLKASLKEN